MLEEYILGYPAHEISSRSVWTCLLVDTWPELRVRELIDLGTKKTSYLPQHLMMRWGENNCKRYSYSKKKGQEVHSSHWSTTILKSRRADVVRFPYSRGMEFFLLFAVFYYGLVLLPVSGFLIHGSPLLLAALWAPGSTIWKIFLLLEITNVYSWTIFPVCFLFIENQSPRGLFEVWTVSVPLVPLVHLSTEVSQKLCGFPMNHIGNSLLAPKTYP